MLNARNFGLAGGILWGVWMFIFTLLSIYTGYGIMFRDLMVDVYPGYSITFFGSVVGFIYGFLDGFIGLYIFAWLYNKLNG